MSHIHITEETIEVRPSPARGEARALLPLPLPIIGSSPYEEGYQAIEGVVSEPLEILDLLEQGMQETVSIFRNLQGDPQMMAEVAQQRAQEIHYTLKCNLLELGYLLYWSDQFKLYSYLRYDSLKEWTENIGINPDIRAHALALYKLWPDMRDMGYDPRVLAEGQVTPTKIPFIAKEIRNWKRQEKAKDQKKTKTPLDDILDLEIEEKLEENDEEAGIDESRVVSADLPRLVEVDTSIIDIKAKIQAIIESRDTDVLAEHNARQGRPEAARIFIRNVRVNTSGLATANISFEADEEQLRQLARGHTAFLFYFPGVDGTLSLQKPDEFDLIIDQLGGIIDEKPQRGKARKGFSDDNDRE